jgi:ABC-type antimicrobial peptide transport system permease subunit
MWFIKRDFISFIKDEKYSLLNQIFKKEKVIFEEKKEFEKKQDLQNYILEQLDEIPQTYISTVTFTLNQGIIDSCSKQAYLDHKIDYDNVKIVCLGGYSLYISIFDLQKIKKDYPFADFIYSPFAIIDYLAKERKNRFYILVFENYLAIVGYENYKPIYSDIVEINEEKHEDEIDDILEDIEEIEEIEDIDDLSEDIEEDIDKIDESELEEKLDEITSSGIESKIMKMLQNSLKEYYENYSSDFIEKIILLDNTGIDSNITKIIEDEILIECEYKKIDALEIINRISRESI